MSTTSVSTSLPYGISASHVLAALHNHDLMIRTLCPALVSYVFESGDPRTRATYQVTDRKPQTGVVSFYSCSLYLYRGLLHHMSRLSQRSSLSTTLYGICPQIHVCISQYLDLKKTHPTYPSLLLQTVSISSKAHHTNNTHRQPTA